MNSNQLNDCLSFKFQCLFLVLMFHYLFLYYSLEIENWPQARSLCDACIGEFDENVYHLKAAASTIVRVWNRQLKI